jgi:phage N-6-adenine-methyltransferase
MGRKRIYKDHLAKQRAYYRRKKRRLRQGTDEWSTPARLFAELDHEFGFTLDVAATPENAKCARYYTREDNGLEQPWTGVVWMNAPYSQCLPQWVAKAHQSAQDGATVICLSPVRSDLEWWHTYVIGREIRFIRGRVKFSDGPGSPPFASCIVVFCGELPHSIRMYPATLS